MPPPILTLRNPNVIRVTDLDEVAAGTALAGENRRGK